MQSRRVMREFAACVRAFREFAGLFAPADESRRESLRVSRSRRGVCACSDSFLLPPSRTPLHTIIRDNARDTLCGFLRIAPGFFAITTR